MSLLDAEIQKLSDILKTLGCPMKRQPPATEEQLAAVATETGLELPSELLDLWRFSNGSNGQFWFVLGELGRPQGGVTPLAFESVELSIGYWKDFAPYDQKVYDEWFDDESWGERDPRIQRHFLRHKAWFPFAELNSGSYLAQVDADPAPPGNVGQIIHYVHDPDGVFWEAEDFFSFFRKSNALLQEALADDRDQLQESLWLI